jgi:integrase
MRVPASARLAIGRAEVRHSLHTGNTREAALLAAWLRLFYHSSFSSWSDGMGFSPGDIARLKRQLANGDLGTYSVSLYDDGRVKKIKSDPNNPEDGRLALEAALKIVAATASTPLSSPAPGHVSAPAPAPVGPTLSAAIKSFLDLMFTPLPKTSKPVEGWDSTKAQIERPHHLDVLLELVGDKPMREIDHDAVVDAKNRLLMLPPNASKSPRFRDKTLAEIVAQQSAALEMYRTKRDSLPKSERYTIVQAEYVRLLAASTVNNYFWTWSEFFGWAARKQFASRNHAEALNLPRDKTRSGRRAFTADEYRTIFESDFYKNADYDMPAKYWVPLLLLYSGGRLNEFCQLVVDDIAVEDGIPCILIFDDEADRQQLKNNESRRQIPIHSKIIGAGFIEYVDAMRAAGSRKLFPELDTGDEKHSKYIGNWHGRYLEKIGVKSGVGIDAHSYRHAAIKRWLNAKVDEKWAAAICGQGYGDDDDEPKKQKKAAGVTFSVYGRLPAPSVLLPYVEMLDWGLTHPRFVMPSSSSSLVRKRVSIR